MYIYPLKIKNIVLYCIVLIFAVIGHNTINIPFLCSQFCWFDSKARVINFKLLY